MPYVAVPDYTEFKTLKGNKAFKSAFDEAIDIKQQIAALEERFDALKDDLEAELVAADAGKAVTYNGWRVQIVDKEGSLKLDKKKLLKLLGPKGVEILTKASVKGKPSHYVQIVSPSQKDGEEE